MKPQFKKTRKTYGREGDFYYEIITNRYYRPIRTKQEIARNVGDLCDARHEYRGMHIKGIRPCRGNGPLNSWNDFSRVRCWKKSWKDFTRQKKQWGEIKSREADDFSVKTRKHHLSLCGEQSV